MNNKLEISEMEKKAKINRPRIEEICKIEKPWASLAKRNKDKIQINRIRNEREDITTNLTEIKRNVREH